MYISNLHIKKYISVSLILEPSDVVYSQYIVTVVLF